MKALSILSFLILSISAHGAYLVPQSIAVTGTFWQSTQPVSGTFYQATQPVSGTFWQSTQPVSLATAPALVASSAVIGHVIVDTIPTEVPSFSNRSDTFTTTGNGTTVNVTTAPVKYFSIQVKGTGASATTWDIRLEGSLDGSNFTQILQHTNTTGDGVVLYLGLSASPSLYFRSRVSGLVLGTATNVVVTILGTD